MRRLLVAFGLALCAQSADANTVWSFDHPATGIPSLDPPYAVVATLSLTQTAEGVQFVLDPNEASPGFADQSFVERLDIAYAGPELDEASFRSDAGAPATFSFEGKDNMDAGYSAAVSHIIVDFVSKKSDDRLSPTGTSTWTVLGADLADFTDTSATANNKPGPTHAVISVTAYALPGPKPTPSNWVTTPEAVVVAEPSIFALLGLGLSGLFLAGTRRA